MTLKFGTDGVRGVANAELTPELVLALGRAAARVLDGDRFLVARDTRISGPLLQAALSAGLAAEGCDVVDLGVVPTPAVAALSEARQLPGAMLSASHNPFPDNGVKFFARGGRKLRDDVEERLEGELAALMERPGDRSGEAPSGADVGRLSRDDGAADWYVEHVLSSLEGRRLDGLTVVLDCAAGAASTVAAAAVRAAGAAVHVIHDRPDGLNINAGCGSTHPASLQRAVLDLGADVGLAFDGDADRVLAVDHEGQLVDGDHLLALCAVDLRRRGRLAGDTVVVTVMTNLGFRLAMAEQGIDVVVTAVGDRYVLEALEEGGYSLGGEQSGHVVFRDLATTGDGLLTGLQLLDVVCRTGPLADLAGAAMTRLPQVLRNVRVAERRPDVEELLGPAIRSVEAELGETGRVLVRPSGTEPLIRVMVEAPTDAAAEQAAARLVAEVERALGPA